MFPRSNIQLTVVFVLERPALGANDFLVVSVNCNCLYIISLIWRLALISLWNETLFPYEQNKSWKTEKIWHNLILEHITIVLVVLKLMTSLCSEPLNAHSCFLAIKRNVLLTCNTVFLHTIYKQLLNSIGLYSTLRLPVPFTAQTLKLTDMMSSLCSMTS
jgi:hypothetical protein